MKRGVVVFFTVFIAAQALVVSSCKKKETLQTPFTRILGTWEKAKYATDDNGNGVIDNSEIHDVQTGIVDELTFKSDSTGNELTNSVTLPYDWNIIEGSSVILSYRANDTVVYYMYEVSSVDLTLTTTTNQGLIWYYYVKK